MASASVILSGPSSNEKLIVDRLLLARWPVDWAGIAASSILEASGLKALDEGFMALIDRVAVLIRPNRFKFWFEAKAELLSGRSPREMFALRDWHRLNLYFDESDL